MRYVAAVFLFCLALLAGCASTEVVRLKRPPSDASAEVLVFREWFFNGGGASARFGADGKNIVVLGSSQLARLQLSPGAYHFFVLGNTGDPFVATMTLDRGEKKCVRIEPNSSNFARAFVPITWHIGNLFTILDGRCPTDEQLKSFTHVQIDYLPE
jgi:hypothetical protein